MRSTFNLSHEHKLSLDMGQLVPVQVDEVLPGDTFAQRSTALTRVAPLAKPLMHRVELRMHSFFVPNRILWAGWEDFITGEDPDTAKPTRTTTGTPGNLEDYMGIPPVAGIEYDALPVNAINMIWNEFYRDQDLQVERDLNDVSIPRCAWQRDYFTIARPDTQQGDPSTIPISGTGTVAVTDVGLAPHTDHQMMINDAEKPNPSMSAIYMTDSTNSSGLASIMEGGYIGIDDLRRSIALQRFAEARMRFGSRYVDYLRYIGVNPSDGRLSRPEYLGGGKETLSFSEVLSTAEVTEANVGDMYGHGIAMGKTNGFNKMFEEHGWCITMMSARPKTVYQNALPRKFTRVDAMDYWQKELEVLPWQEVNQREVDASGDVNTVFGYVPRYEEYRHGVSCVSGTLRGGTEEDWHMARSFETPPTLNSSFIECTPTDRVYQDSNQPDLIINCMHDIKASRFVGETASMGVDL